MSGMPRFDQSPLSSPRWFNPSSTMTSTPNDWNRLTFTEEGEDENAHGGNLSTPGDESWPTPIAVRDDEDGDFSPLRTGRRFNLSPSSNPRFLNPSSSEVRPRFNLSPLSSPRWFNPSSSEVHNPQDDGDIFDRPAPSSMHGRSFRGAESPWLRLPLLPVAPQDFEADDDTVPSNAIA